MKPERDLRPAILPLSLRGIGYAVAGKTGSSEVGSDDAWFTGYAPYRHMNPSDPESISRADEAPKIVVTSLINNGGHGGDSAAPVARDVIRAAFDDDGNFLAGPRPRG